MADQDFALTHDELMVFGVPQPGSVLNDHEVTSLSTAVDRWVVAYKHGANRNRILTNDLPHLRNAPLRVSLKASSAAVHTTTGANFNKGLPVPTGALNVEGAVLWVDVGGTLGTKASAPGTGGPTIYLTDHTNQHNLCLMSATLTAGLLEGVSRWKASAIGTVRVPGGAGVSVIKGCGDNFIVPGTGHQMLTPTTVITSLSLTGSVALDVYVFWNWSVADIANTAMMDTGLVRIFYPGTVVS